MYYVYSPNIAGRARCCAALPTPGPQKKQECQEQKASKRDIGQACLYMFRKSSLFDFAEPSLAVRGDA